MRPTRREVVFGIGGITTSAIGFKVLSGNAKGSTLEAGLTIPDRETSISQPVTAVPIHVEGSFNIDAEATPTKIVLRFEAKRSNSETYTQVAATDWRSDLSKTFSSDFDLSGNLLSLPEVNAGDLRPTEVGQTNTLTINAKVSLAVFKDGTKLESHVAKDTATLGITRDQATVTVSMDVQGNMSVET